VGAGAPLAGAQVLYTNRDGTGLAEVATDARGAFEVQAPYPLEDGLLLIQARGFAPLETGPHAIRAGERRFVGNLEVQRGVPLSGKVTDAGGAAVSGAQVYLRAAGPGGGYNRHVQSAVTDTRGAFRFPDAPTGGVLLEARAPGFGSRAQDLQHSAATD
jgi:protocatechuate 3,4-dioxygenase beta subunit